jgi:hypothetical protein
MSDVAALLGGADELLDGCVGEVGQRQQRVERFGRLFFSRLFLFFLSLSLSLFVLTWSCSPYISPEEGRPGRRCLP